MSLRPVAIESEEDLRLANVLVRILCAGSDGDATRQTLRIIGEKLDCEAVEMWFASDDHELARCVYKSNDPHVDCHEVSTPLADSPHGEFIASLLAKPISSNSGTFASRGNVTATAVVTEGGKRGVLAVVSPKAPDEVVTRFLSHFAGQLCEGSRSGVYELALQEAKHRVVLARRIAYAILHPSEGSTLSEALEAATASFPDLTIGYIETDDGRILRVVDAAGVRAEAFRNGSFDLTAAPRYSQAVRNREVIAIGDVESETVEEALRVACRAGNTRAFVSVPIGLSREENNSYGMVFFSSSRPRIWSEFEIESLTETAELLLIAAKAALQEAVQIQAREEIRLQRDVLTRILDVAATALTVVDDGKVIVFNRECERISGFPATDIIGKNVEELPDGLGDAMTKLWGRFQKQETQTRYIELDWVSLTGEVRRMSWHLSEPSSAADRPVMVASGLDVTVTQKLREDLEQSRRITSLGRLAATVAHEFNNVMMSILPFTEVIRRSAPEHEKIQNAVTHMIRAIDRGRRVTQDLLRFTRPGEPAFRRIDAVQWLREFAAESRAMLPEKIELVVTVDDEPIYISADPLQLGQVFNNLVTNARDALPEGGTITLSLRELDAATAERVGYGQSAAVLFQVTDDGEGISPEIRDTIFEPLFTTKRSGTGLGLAIARQIVATHRASIFVDSRKGKGTTFSLMFPPASNVTPPATGP
jgi:PAS domain S-box-containing protein